MFKSFLFVGAIFAQSALATTVYFGTNEVQAGQLKSATGELPAAGQVTTLAVDLPGLATTVACDQTKEQNCAALEPRLFVRYSSHEQFQEVSAGFPKGYISPRGPEVRYDYDGSESNRSFPVNLAVPANADRIEAYMIFNRYHYYASGCYMAYDMTECDTISQQLDGERYISNFGRNFQIPIRH